MKSIELYEQILKEKSSVKSRIDIIHVNDFNSRFYGGRFSEDLVKLGQFYDVIATFNYMSMSSEMFIEMFSQIDPRNETVVILDNIKDARVFDIIQKLKLNAYKKIIGDNSIDDNDVDTHNKIRMLQFRAIYLLDEFVWEGIAGRSKSIYDCRVIEDLMNVSDTIVVPNGDMCTALLDIGFVQENRKNDVIVMPITVSSTVYPVNSNVFARTHGTVIEKPSILIKGAELSKNLCEFIIKKHNKYKITISTICQLPDELMLLVNAGTVRHITHYTSPTVNGKNIIRTFTDERDMKFDFVIYSSSEMMYDLAMGDADAIFSVAAGSCVLACVKKDWFEKDSHVCCSTGTAFYTSTSYNKIDDIVHDYSVTVKWNELYRKQRGYIENKISDKPVSLGRLFAVIIGKDMAEKRFAGDENESTEK